MGGLFPLDDQTDAVAAMPRTVSDLGDCYFYHSMHIPGHGFVAGEWDLRGGESAYLGGVSTGGKRVLEVGTADGFLSFHMEREGAQVISYDLDAGQCWDAVPFARAAATNGGGNWVREQESFRHHITRLNNAYWLGHHAFGSAARMVYGHVYAIPDEIGTVDVTTLGALLLHTRDPFQAVASAARLTRETIIVTEARGRLFVPPAVASLGRLIPRRLHRPAMRFLPDWRAGQNADGWWRLSPEILTAFLGVLGFEDTRVTHHTQLHQGRRRRCFTVVGRRTVT